MDTNNLACLLISLLLTHFCNCDIADNEVEVCNLTQQVIDEIAGYRPIAQQIINATINGKFKGTTSRHLADFVDKFGSRITGSENLENAIDYMLKKSKEANLENVHGEEAAVPHWIRGNESATLLEPRHYSLTILGLGSSIGTPSEGICAEALVVSSFDELKNISTKVNGRIVIFNPEYIDYSTTVKYRLLGASIASTYGAVGTLVRSVTPFSLNTPHTGWQEYQGNVKKIPTASITVEDANMLQRMYERGEKLVIQIKMEARSLPLAISRNTVVEIIGNKRPEKSVIISGHLDSWDVGQGAMDDGGGAFISWNSLVLLKALGLRAKRTIRGILWTGEEEGVSGSAVYVKAHADESANFNFVMESDEGTFTPRGLKYTGSKTVGCILQQILNLLEPINATTLDSPADGGPDINLWLSQGIPGASLLNEAEKYFWYHHSAADTMDVEDPDALDKCMAVWATAAYIIADLSFDMPRSNVSN